MWQRFKAWLHAWSAPALFSPTAEPSLPPSFMALIEGPYGQAMKRAVVKANMGIPIGKHSRVARHAEALEWFGHYLYEQHGLRPSSVHLAIMHLLLEWWVVVLDGRLAYDAAAPHESA